MNPKSTTARKENFEWSDSGLDLLQTIENIITQSGGSQRLANLIQFEHYNDHNCHKKNCFYCQEMKRQFEVHTEYVLIPKDVIETNVQSLQFDKSMTAKRVYVKVLDRISGKFFGSKKSAAESVGIPIGSIYVGKEFNQRFEVI